MTAPIALFVYNRPEHTKKTIEALQKNDLANESNLYIFSDAAKHQEATVQVQAVREYIASINGFKSVTIINRNCNLGLADSIVDGVTKLCNSDGKAIILEDDIVTSKGFLRFMNNALNLYADDEKVMHISGYMFGIDKPEEIPETFFYRVPSCWGWATWKRAWEDFEPDAANLLDRLNLSKKKYDFDIENTYDYSEMLQMQASGKLNSWAIRWYASVFLNNGLCLHPNKSFTNNIGLDGSGTNCGTSNSYEISDLKEDFSINAKLKLDENQMALQKIKNFNKSKLPHFYRRFVRKILKIAQKILLKG
ncbi:MULTISPECIES: glycosyltransferase family 2 protein [unclassified Methylophaga]|jgi:hypothetical protein|uniref:glycosyltransferase family 2 protein n=1 Tax=unclassified Methylophaga TaxID=2629249 RepID=UPI000C409420|nr:MULTISPECIES: glycosyltransferase family 2 protein [unclassified Methylophaga]MAL49842.1 glycosyl transferase [Methylophaga sp.]MAM28208.1 glycosyl transferase [Flavobacteriaceae bacterium]MBP24073.1 glycosyl transferase [Methylophaga sp.]HCC80512.1 glycosyl transferase [Methylophaga sp.]|tara:strand:+ start:3858 stop:4778 length:921 start_codon:yes stop_codon:yes gene_type:complete